MTLVGEINPQLRVLVHILGFLGLIFLFSRKYGLDFRNYKKIPGKVFALLMLLFFAMSISTLFSNYPQMGVLKIFQLIYFFAIIYFVYSLLNDDTTAKTLLSAVILSGIIMALSIIINMFKYGFDPLALVSNFEFRSGGLLSNINALSGFWVVGIPLTFMLAYYQKIKTIKYLLFIAMLIMLLALLTTVSRAVMLATFISICIILYRLKKKFFFRFLFGSIAFIIIILFFTPLGAELELLLRLGDGLSNRNFLWQIAFNMISSRPLTGIGPGAYGFEMFNYFPILLDSYEGKLFIELQHLTFGFNGSHNFYLALFSDLGVLGFIVSLLLPLTFFQIASKTIKYFPERNSSENRIIWCFIAIGAGMFIRGFFEGISLVTYGWITVDMPFWLIYSLLIHYYTTNQWAIENSSKYLVSGLNKSNPLDKY